MSVIDTLMVEFDLGEEDALELLDHVAEADLVWTQAIHGYPKDNKIPPPLPERLADPRWRDAFRRILEDDDELESALRHNVLDRL